MNVTMEVVPVDALKVGDMIKVDAAIWRIESIEEHPRTRCFLLSWPKFTPRYTYKRRSTLVYREVRRA